MVRRKLQQNNKKRFGKQSEDGISFAIDSFDIIYGKNVILENSKLVIEHGQHYGLVGKNGLGKTSLLTLLESKRLKGVPENLDVIYVRQEEPESDKTAIETLMSSDTVLGEKQKRLEDLDELLSQDPRERNLQSQGGVPDDILEEYRFLGQEIGSEYDKRLSEAKRILVGLGVKPTDHTRPIREFSGGWRMRLSIAKSLFMMPSLLLLDEPTNHMDFGAVFWLKSYLRKYPKTLVVVSHDRYFIDDVCTCIITIKDKQLQYYSGNYTNYERQLSLCLAKQKKDWDLYNKRLRTMKTTKTPADVAKFIQKSKVSRPDREYVVKISFMQPPIPDSDLITLSDVSFSFPGRKDNVLSGVNMVVSPSTRMLVTGDNGVGKSTLFKLITGDLVPNSGVIDKYPKLRVGFYHQHFESSLPFELTPVQYLMSLNKNLDLTSAHKYLSMFGLEPINHKTLIKDLSGGQKSRVKFASFGVTRPHVLLLDEPTNHLDITAIQSLITALNDFDCAVLLITHNLEVMTSLNCEIWKMSDGQLIKQPPDYINYVETLYDEE